MNGAAKVPTTAELHTGLTDADPAVVDVDRDDSPQAVTYQESLLEGANPDEGFYE